MPTVSLPPQILESPPATLEGIVDLNAFANWFLPDDQVRAFLEALGNN